MEGLVLYISCMADMTAEKQSTLTTKQQCDPENSRREGMPEGREKASADENLHSEWKFRKKEKKKRSQ